MALADRQRRARAAADELRRLAPAVAGLALVFALAARFLLGWPAWAGLVALVAGAVALGAYVAILRRARPTTDAIALAVDADAHLAGELRSAHWFEDQTEHDPWAAFHLKVATDHARGVDWASLYPRTPAARSWVATAVLSVVVVGLAIRLPAPTQAAGDAAAAAAEIGAQLPIDLQKKLAALLAEMDLADAQRDPAAKEMALADLKDLMAKLDPAMQKKLADMLEKRALDKNEKADAASKDDERAERAENSTAGLPEDVKWALENEAAKMAQSNDDRKTAEQNPSATQETGEKGAGSAQAQQETSLTPVAAPLVREAASDPGGKMMMGGGGPMGGDSRPGAGGNNKDAQGAAEALLLAQALRKELVEASADALGENVDKEDLRRKTEQGKSSLGFTRAAEPREYEPSRATAPPPVPEARRSLLFSYFIRRR